jgi:hypothetical protein
MSGQRRRHGSPVALASTWYRMHVHPRNLGRGNLSPAGLADLSRFAAAAGRSNVRRGTTRLGSDRLHGHALGYRSYGHSRDRSYHLATGSLIS